MDACVPSHFSHTQLFVTLWTVAQHARLSMGFSRQVYWSGLPFPPPEDFPNPGIEPGSLMSPTLTDKFFITSTTWQAPKLMSKIIKNVKNKRIKFLQNEINLNRSNIKSI